PTSSGTPWPGSATGSAACWCCATATAAPTPRSPRRWAAGEPPSAAWRPARRPDSHRPARRVLMTRLFDTGQPADGLEDELRRMLAVLENDITEAGRPPLEGDRLTLPPHRTSWVTELPGGRAGTLLAAAVVALLVLGSAFAVRGLRS